MARHAPDKIKIVKLRRAGQSEIGGSD